MSNTTGAPHIALFPSAGMGHLTPFLRIAAALLSRGCTVTLITAKPTVSAAESSHIASFLSRHPQVKHVDFHTIPLQHSTPTTDDPFFLQFNAISRSVHLLRPLLSCLSSPPLSAIFADFAAASNMTSLASELGVPTYIVSTSSVKFLCLAAHLPELVTDPTKLNISSSEVNVPGLTPLPLSSLPPPFLVPNHLFTSTIATNSRALSRAKGIIVNSFDWFEPENLEAINSGRVLDSLPPVLPIGPLETICEENNEKEKEKEKYMSWLDSQAMESVVYVSFGSRTAMSRDQIRELSEGLERSGHRFLWVLKTSKVDREDKQELRDLLGEPFLERTKDKGLVVKSWVRQQEILGHPAVGAFVNHCGWNSVTEAARWGVPVVAWPQHGDQKLNAEVVERAGLGTWERSWGWGGQELVSGDAIGTKIREAMEDEKMRKMARKVGEEAKKAVGVGGTSEKVLKQVLEYLKQKSD